MYLNQLERREDKSLASFYIVFGQPGDRSLFPISHSPVLRLSRKFQRRWCFQLQSPAARSATIDRSILLIIDRLVNRSRERTSLLTPL